MSGKFDRKERLRKENGELRNVSGGVLSPTDIKELRCPSCDKIISRGKSLVEKKGCGITIESYRCEHCGHEWQQR